MRTTMKTEKYLTTVERLRCTLRTIGSSPPGIDGSLTTRLVTTQPAHLSMKI
jgi:hypothetical protein